MKAVVLLSGGLDSATVLGLAKKDERECIALSFAYGQRHEIELAAARRVANAIGVAEHIVYPLDLRLFGASALTDSINVPRRLLRAHSLNIATVPSASRAGCSTRPI